MSQLQKLISRIRNSRNDVRFDDACKVAERLGYIGRTRGSHNVYAKPGVPGTLNFQNCNGFIPKYQVDQLIAVLDEYKDELK